MPPLSDRPRLESFFWDFLPAFLDGAWKKNGNYWGMSLVGNPLKRWMRMWMKWEDDWPSFQKFNSSDSSGHADVLTEEVRRWMMMRWKKRRGIDGKWRGGIKLGPFTCDHGLCKSHHWPESVRCHASGAVTSMAGNTAPAQAGPPSHHHQPRNDHHPWPSSSSSPAACWTHDDPRLAKEVEPEHYLESLRSQASLQLPIKLPSGRFWLPADPTNIVGCPDRQS